MRRINALRQEIKALDTVDALLDAITKKRLERFSFILLTLFVLSPLYAMLWSLLFATHKEAAYIGNLFGLANAWHTLIIQTGYIGVIVAIILVAKAKLKAKREATTMGAFIKMHKIEIFLALFIFWTGLATVFSINPSQSLNGDFYRKEGLWTFGAYLGIFALSKTQSKASVLRLATLFVGVSAMLAVLNLIDAETLNRLFTLKKRTSIFHNPNHYGYYLVMSLMANTLLVLNLKRLNTPLIAPLMIFHTLISMTIIDNQSFGAFVAPAFTFMVVLVLIGILRRMLLLRTFMLAAMFFGVAITQSLADDYLTNEVSSVREDVANIIEDTDDAPSAGSGRWSLWTHGIQFALDHPLFGYGPDALGDPYGATGHNTDRPHNEWIQFAASQGIPALMFYLSSLVSLAFLAFNQRHSLSTLTLTLGFVIIAYLTSSMFGNTMYYTTPFYVMFLSFTVSGVQSSKTNFIR